MFNQLKIGTKIGISFALGLAIFGAIGFMSYRNAKYSIASDRMQTHTYQVIGEIEALVSLLKDAETGQRGYIITGDAQYLQPYETAVQTINDEINALRILTADDPIQQERLDEVQALVIQRLAVLEQVIETRQQSGLSAAVRLVQQDQGRQLMQDIRRLIAEMKAEENELLEERVEQSQIADQQTINSILLGFPIAAVLLGGIGLVLSRNISKPLEEVSSAASQLAAGDLSVYIPNRDRRDEIGILAQTFNQMVASLRETTAKNEAQNWLKSNLADFGRLLQGRQDLETVARVVMSELVPLVNAQHGVFYIMDMDNRQPLLRLLGSYAYQERKHLGNQFKLGEGLVGQSALEKKRILLTEVPSDYIRIGSGLGESVPLNVLVLPLLFEETVTGVIEVASFQPFNDIHIAFLEQVSETIAVVLTKIYADIRTEQLLRQSQTLTEELQTQQEELQERNEELTQQAEELQASEALLTQQQEELQQSNEELQQLNEELEEKAELLALQKQEVERKNQALEQTRRALEEKAEELALTSKYKSEFLANMSHELRTPLNSLLILSKMLADNGSGNLSAKQVEYSQTIHAAGTDLLGLINDILDLAKIESGTLSIEISPIQFEDLNVELERTFRQLAIQKGLDFAIALDDNLPAIIQTDSKRLLQVLKNLLSNAFKFTDQGQVSVRIHSVTQGWKTMQTSLEEAEHVIAFTVTDTGIGIPPEKRQIIFEAFQQVDGTTSRKYGGTGLGLSISREISHLLGGQITLSSTLGQGSTFTLYLPQHYQAPAPTQRSDASPQQSAPLSAPSSPDNGSMPTLPAAPDPTLLLAPSGVNDDRDTLQPGDRVLLIIEDDINFARILLDLARQQGFKGLVALRSQVGLALAQEFQPDAITLDLHLPDMDGWTVLDRLKHNSNTRHIPVHVLSIDEAQQRALQLGAIAYLQKPVSGEDLTQALTAMKQFVERPMRNLLVVEDDDLQRQSIVDLIGNGDVHTTAVATGADALAALQIQQFDCLVLDLGLPDMTGLALIEQIKLALEDQGRPPLPIIVYTGKELTRQEETQLKRLTDTIIIKDVRSPERLLDETSLFLHRVQANLPLPQRKMLQQLHETDPVLMDKKVLIVDDDVRNIFALTSLLEEYQMQVLFAENGQEGIDLVQQTPDLDIVLMDVMMPGMDGYETMRQLRQRPELRHLPIIALTAKAMQGDREKCIEAGASDYIAKPVDSEQLISLLRVWLYR